MIIAHSPTRQPSMEMPNRVVIRDLGAEYVVHTECFEGGKSVGYHWGSYFRKNDDPDAALREAWERFEERSRRLLGIQPETVRGVQRDLDECDPSEEDLEEGIRQEGYF